MIHPPAPLSGNHPLASWLNKLREFCIYTAPQGIVGGRMRQDSGGTFFEVAPGGGGVGGAELYKVKSVHGDYLTCYKTDGTTDVETDVNVAKPHELRESVTSITLYSAATATTAVWSADLTYDDSEYHAQRIRYADDSDVPAEVETQYVNPIWQIDGFIYAIAVDFSGVTVSGSDLKLLDLNVAGRVWAREYAPPNPGA